MITLQGTGVSTGIACGTLKFYHRETGRAELRTVENPEAEIARYSEATEKAVGELEALAEKARSGPGGEDIAGLFETHAMMLGDLDFVETVEGSIREHKYNAEYAVSEAGKSFAGMLSAMDDPYMQARSADVADITGRVVRILSGGTLERETDAADAPYILASDDLTPSETVKLDKTRVLGFTLSAGNQNSHTAILARTLGIPAVIGLGEGLKPELEGRYVILDGSTGQAVIDPDADAKAYLAAKQLKEKQTRERRRQLIGREDVTADGREIRLFANISSPADTDAVIANDARGIGLFRSEFLYLGRESCPGEEEQLEAYKSVLLRMNGKRVIIRTLDAGADKKLECLGLPKEENPALGMRAIRVCLSRPELFKTQLRALYRASAFGKLSIMFPMIASVWEVREIKRICAAVRAELKREKQNFDENTPLGIMIETPAAAVISDLLAKESDFFSIGTNDLTQYTLAADRQGSPGMERFSDPTNTAVLRLISLTIENAHKAGIRAGICGELAGDPKLTQTLISMGADELSVSPRNILCIREKLIEADSRLPVKEQQP